MRINFQAIVPLRCLILKTTDPSSYAILMGMESHNDIRKNIQDLWALNQTRVVNRIVKDWKLTEFSEDEIHTICGILEVRVQIVRLFYFFYYYWLLTIYTGKRVRNRTRWCEHSWIVPHVVFAVSRLCPEHESHRWRKNLSFNHKGVDENSAGTPDYFKLRLHFTGISFFFNLKILALQMPWSRTELKASCFI